MTRSLLALLMLAASTAFAADVAKGTFHFGNINFEPVDAFAYQDTSADPAKPLTIVLLANFKIDRAAAVNAIDTPGALIDQAGKTDGGAFLVLRVVSAEHCGIYAFLNQAQRQIDLSNSYAAKGVTVTASRVAGECATTKPEKMFDDSYDFHLSYDVPLTAISKPATLTSGGGEPGAVYAGLVKAIQAADWNAAHLLLPPDQVPDTKPKPSEMKGYFHDLGLNYPKTVNVAGGLMKGDSARIEISGTNSEGKKIKGTVAMKKVASGWQVVDQSFYGAD
ncbi:MAG: hypothetical protein JO093_23990 [Acidobacteria bacterium]|nr:hypothetical protein [Acidobacteriota bacterium]MBV9070717.1 hypothetical protein [Acidobacteriota bacterium]MBV9188691.1 hypothetical protein [Acidobacteriota bacterium]